MLNVKYKMWPCMLTTQDNSAQLAVCYLQHCRSKMPPGVPQFGSLQSEPSKAHIKSPTQNLATNNTVVDTKKQTQLQQLSRVRSCRKLRGIFLCGFQRQFPPQNCGDLLKIEAIRGQFLRVRIGRYIYICIGRPRPRHQDMSRAQSRVELPTNLCEHMGV